MTAYRKLDNTRIDEVNGTLAVYEHLRTGATIIHVKNDDEQKVFMAAFRTLPGDSTGVARIMEHSVLDGSVKYPLKEPFVELMKGSLNTYLNAFTSEDNTMYPIVTPNMKDY